MAGTPLDFDPYRHDPSHWGASLAHMAELMLPCMDAAGARSVAEIGALAGDLTGVLVAWAERAGARVTAVDPAPQDGLVALARAHDALELIAETSLEALARMPLPDVLIVDGDHNYYTVSEELRLVDERAAGGALPLLFFHDVGWPHGRRDDFYAIERIPQAERKPLAGDRGGLVPGAPGIDPRGLPYPRSAAREGGPRNGVLTAVEDFVAGRDGLRLVVVPAFFGFGAVWQRDAPWAAAVAAILDPWDGHPLLERMEANRILHLAHAHERLIERWALEARQARQEAVLRRLMDSSAFALAERLSRIRLRLGIGAEHEAVSKAMIRRALDD